jgi:hypothetical protein
MGQLAARMHAWRMNAIGPDRWANRCRATCSLVIDALSAREEDDVLRQRLSAPRTLHAPHHLDVEVTATVRGLAAGKKPAATMPL